MLFNSSTFFAFAAIFYVLFYLLRSQSSRLLLIASASLLFYASWDWRFTFLLVASGLLDFMASLGMQAWPQWRKLLLIVSLAGNLGILFTFKYANFVLGLCSAAWGSESPWRGLDIVLPVGISFYTFQSMSYTIDVYRGDLKPSRSLREFFSYLALFPQLVAGPIERGTSLLSQLGERRHPTAEQLRDGWGLVVLGYFQKTVIADNLAPYVDHAFAESDRYESGLFWWLVAAMFALQIYSDFSGYSNIARGLAKFMGIELMRNFDSPYAATSFQDFWGRWHISLSTWLRDYLYIPLGGSRVSTLRAHGNLWITLLVSGLWHGAGLTFVLWGAFHATLLSVERISSWPRRLARFGSVGTACSRAIVVPMILLSWIIFRSTNLTEAGTIIARMLTLPAADIPRSGLLLTSLTALTVGLAWIVMEILYLRAPIRLRLAGIGCWVVPWLAVASIYFRGAGNAFIYFQF